MSKKNVVARIADQFPKKADAEKAVDIVLAGIEAELRAQPVGGKVTLPGFGIFYRKFSPERDAKNPQTGETVRVAARDRVTFRSKIDL